MIVFQYFTGNIKDSHPLGWVSVDQFIRSTREPSEKSLSLFKSIAECSDKGDVEGKSRLKEQLYSFTPCVHFKESGRRCYDDIVQWTGLLVLDFDKIHNAPDFKEYLFDEYSFIYACYLSPSRKGVKALVKIPESKSVDEFKAYYFGIAEIMDSYNGFDASGQNSVLPLFQSYDPELLYREDSTTWQIKGFKRGDFVTASTTPNPVQTDQKFIDIIIKIINSGIDKITDNGHPQLRSICQSVGGYIANNYIDYQTAIQQIDFKIDTNGYLKKGIPGYKKTARWAIDKGLSKPLTLNFNR